MVKIRLARIGEKKTPMYRIVVADANKPRNGKKIAEIGTFNPNVKPHDVKIDAELAKEWLNKGAQPTIVVAKLFRQAGITK
ncbi:MAG: 30S ribosomal protein S16 [Lachnospiraceae bacterium]|jgi:small subunit ribosomal protein S16|nr:30S ribosomal protein S16 [Lachnospiraceae bacterium]